MRVPTRWWLATILPAAWLVLLGDALWIRYRDPFGRSPTHPGYGENFAGDLSSSLVIGAVEIAVLSAVLRPWSAKPIWPRALAALVLFAPWSLVAAMMGMHAGSIDAAHTMWRFGLVFAIAGACLLSGLRAVARRLAAV